MLLDASKDIRNSLILSDDTYSEKLRKLVKYIMKKQKRRQKSRSFLMKRRYMKLQREKPSKIKNKKRQEASRKRVRAENGKFQGGA